MAKSDDLKSDGQVLADCELMKLFRESEIPKNYRQRATVQKIRHKLGIRRKVQHRNSRWGPEIIAYCICVILT